MVHNHWFFLEKMCDADGKEWKEKKKLKRLTKMPSFVLLSLKVEELIKHLEIEFMIKHSL